ncbi:FAD-dependent monooxygenase [Ottowia testudinis]|uniref:FAD-dependent monooxygenase n=1 Tax=Ottowia testudinis TaxID=2816950 RepID=A0A975CFF3_9BURK|nr:FAD-dependent monooxygenase [Ottowia testudinis]QTD44096.1 FAD-dependent monooxygenase [Ottowia testudinis]
MKSKECNVIVVGAGPSGLWIACELSLARLKVCVIERRAEPMSQSRSLTIHGRTLEMFAMRGLHERFLQVGRPMPSWHFAGLPTALDFSSMESRHPYMLFIAQTQTERLLQERAMELGVEFHRGCTASHIAQSEKGVEVHVHDASGTRRIDAAYLVGADGARSQVRQQAGIAFPGMAATQSVMMADAQVDLPDGKATLSIESAAGGLTILPLGQGKQRIIRLDPERRHVDSHEPLSEGELRESLVRIAGHDFSLRNATWLTRFSDETRLADTYRQGRIFLLGDAAHIHAPMGGQGLNVGLQDAMNLGWKLGAVAKSKAPAVLLDTYEAERRPEGQRLLQSTLAQVALTSRYDEAGLALRRTVSEFLRHPSLNRQLAGELSCFDLCYPQPLPGFESSQGALGWRMPDCNVISEDGESSSIYAHLAGGSWLHLELVSQERQPLPDWLSSREVQQVRASIDTCPALNGMKDVLVRPDGYVAAARFISEA